MLKRLVKYGNSTGLVIDKAILELLNITEATMVKLTTDGKSLTITPVVSSEADKASYSHQEAIFTIGSKLREEHESKMATDTDYQAMFQKQLDHTQPKIMAIFAKYKNVLDAYGKKSTTDQEYLDATQALSKQYDPITQKDEYLAQLLKLRNRFCPELAEFDREMAEAYASVDIPVATASEKK